MTYSYYFIEIIRIFFCNQILLFASWAAHLLRINLCKCMPTWACEREEIVVYARCIKPSAQLFVSSVTCSAGGVVSERRYTP